MTGRTSTVNRHAGRHPKRGEVWLISFEPQVGAEVRKKRPAVVLSAAFVGRLPLKIVVPITEWNDSYSRLFWLVPITPDELNKLDKMSAADAFQVKSVSLERFVRPIGVLASDLAEEIAATVAVCIGTKMPS